MRTVPFYYHFAERREGGLLMEAIRPRSVAQNPSLGKRGERGEQGVKVLLRVAVPANVLHPVRVQNLWVKRKCSVSGSKRLLRRVKALKKFKKLCIT